MEPYIIKQQLEALAASVERFKPDQLVVRSSTGDTSTFARLL